MKLSFRHFGKIGFILVIIGFLLPISGNLNGFQLASSMMNNISFFEIMSCLLLICFATGITFGGIGLLIPVAILFSIPFQNNQNGFQFVLSFINNLNLDGILFCMFFLYAIVGIIFGVVMSFRKKIEPLADWVIIVLCIGCGLTLYFRLFNDNAAVLQYGAFVILGGWIIALVFQILSKMKKEVIEA